MVRRQQRQTARRTRDTAGGPGPSLGPSRREQGKARTRSALIRAAERLIADGGTDASILQITEAADVGLGSFYNHFDSREALFGAAVDEALETVGKLLDQLGARLDDPAEVFAQSFRLTGRLLRREPALMHVALSEGPALMQTGKGLAPRARRDIEAGIRSGRFSFQHAELALAITVGAVLGLAELLRQSPRSDGDADTDVTAAALLTMLGVPRAEADEISRRPLPKGLTPALTRGSPAFGGRTSRYERSGVEGQ